MVNTIISFRVWWNIAKILMFTVPFLYAWWSFNSLDRMKMEVSIKDNRLQQLQTSLKIAQHSLKKSVEDSKRLNNSLEELRISKDKAIDQRNLAWQEMGIYIT